MRETDQQKQQKQEWADIYGGMKKEADDLKRDIKYLNGENEKLLIQIEQLNKRGAPSSGIVSSQGGSSAVADKELAKKLRKREAECFALWDTLKDMRQSGSQQFNVNQMMDLLAQRSLDGKAKRKLNL